MPLPRNFELVGTAFQWFHDGRSLILNGKISNGSPGFYQVDTQSGEAKFLMPNTHGVQAYAPWLSPNGKTIVYGVINQSILVRNLESGEERALYEAAQRPRLNTGFSISPDNEQVAFSTQDIDQEFATIQIVPIAGGAGKSLKVKVPLARRQELGVAWAPDGRSLFFLMRPTVKAPHELWQISVADGEVRRTELAKDELRDINIHPDGRQIAFGVFTGGGEIWALENYLPATQSQKTSVSRLQSRRPNN